MCTECGRTGPVLPARADDVAAVVGWQIRGSSDVCPWCQDLERLAEAGLPPVGSAEGRLEVAREADRPSA